MRKAAAFSRATFSLHLHTCMHMCVYEYIYTRIYNSKTLLHLRVLLLLCICVRARICAYTNMYVYMCMHM